MPPAAATAVKGRRKARRRTPQQERSQHTVDAILTAAKIMAIRSGVRGLTTNGVAKLAGVSIGSLYQYFPSRRAIVEALRKQHQEAGERIFRAEAEQLFDAPLPVATRRFVEKMVEVHRFEPELHRALELEGRGSGFGEWERQAVGIVRAYLEHHRAEIALADLDQAAFICMIVAEAITHGSVVEQPALLGDATLVDGVVRMLLAYLGVTSGAFPPAPPL